MIQLLLQSFVFVSKLSYSGVSLFRSQIDQSSHTLVFFMQRNLNQLKRTLHFHDQILKQEEIALRSASFFDYS